MEGLERDSFLSAPGGVAGLVARTVEGPGYLHVNRFREKNDQ